MGNFKNIKFCFCDRSAAKKVCAIRHYMKTYPQGAVINIAMVDNGKLVGIVVFGYSSQTGLKIVKLVSGLEKKQYIEMQRLWISDDYGHNTESYCLSKIIKLLTDKYNFKIIVTHAGGCKDDCGIVYQASGWLYFGSNKCNDFFLTEKGEYKNTIAAIRFGRVKSKGKSSQQIGEELFGAGKVVFAHRYFYCYPIDKGIRRRLTKIQQPFPKQSAHFRKNQQWVKGGAAGAGGESFGGSIPSFSTKK